MRITRTDKAFQWHINNGFLYPIEWKSFYSMKNTGIYIYYKYEDILPSEMLSHVENKLIDYWTFTKLMQRYDVSCRNKPPYDEIFDKLYDYSFENGIEEQEVDFLWFCFKEIPEERFSKYIGKGYDRWELFRIQRGLAADLSEEKIQKYLIDEADVKITHLNKTKLDRYCSTLKDVSGPPIMKENETFVSDPIALIELQSFALIPQRFEEMNTLKETLLSMTTLAQELDADLAKAEPLENEKQKPMNDDTDYDLSYELPYIDTSNKEELLHEVPFPNDGELAFYNETIVRFTEKKKTDIISKINSETKKRNVELSKKFSRNYFKVLPLSMGLLFMTFILSVKPNNEIWSVDYLGVMTTGFIISFVAVGGSFWNKKREVKKERERNELRKKLVNEFCEELKDLKTISDKKINPIALKDIIEFQLKLIGIISKQKDSDAILNELFIYKLIENVDLYVRLDRKYEEMLRESSLHILQAIYKTLKGLYEYNVEHNYSRSLWYMMEIHYIESYFEKLNLRGELEN